MKANKIFYAMALCLAVAACSPKETEAQAPEEGTPVSAEAVTEAPEGVPHEPTLAEVTPSKGLVDSVSYLYGIYIGSMLSSQNFGEDLNLAKMKQGLKDFYKSCQDPQDSLFATQFKIDPMVINDVITKFLTKRRELVAFQNKQKEIDYFAKLDKQEGIQKTESGLRYTVLEAGNGVAATTRDTVMVRYKLTLSDGKVLEEIPADAEAVRMPLSGGMIPGFIEGAQLVGEGGKVTIYVPSELGYGPYGNRGIDPYSPLQFDITIEKVLAAPAAEAE